MQDRYITKKNGYNLPRNG